MKTKFLIFVLLFTLGFSLTARLGAVTRVQAEGLTCIGDYYHFILNVRSEKLRSESVKDFFTLGYCQLNDIMAIDDELDSLKESFRTAAGSCNSTTSYQKDYQRLLLEMYFVRHLQDGEAINAVDEEQLDTLKEQKLESLELEMKTAFVDEEKMVTEEEFDNYFQQWSAEYDDRVADYRKCEEGPWAELTVTWTDFVETLQELDFSVEVDKTKSLKDILKPDVEVDTDKDMTALGNSVKNAWEYLKTKKDKIKTEEVTPSQTVSELGSEGGSITFDEAFSALNTSFADYSIEERFANRQAEYEVIYGGASVQSTNLQNIVAQLNAVLQEMNNKDLPSVAGNSAKVSDKQCN